MGEIIRLGSKPLSSSGVIRLNQPSSTKKYATIGEQLEKIKTLPQPLRTLANPTLTVGLLGTLSVLTGAAIPAAVGKTALAAGTVEFGKGVLTTSKTVDEAVSKRVRNPKGAGEDVGKFFNTAGEKVGSAAETLKKAGTTAKEKAGGVIQTIKDNPLTTAAIAGAGLVGGTALASYIKTKLSTPKATTLQTISQPVGAPVFSGGVPTAPAAQIIPIEKPTATEKPMKISQKVDINIKNSAIGKRTSKKFIKNVSYIG